MASYIFLFILSHAVSVNIHLRKLSFKDSIGVKNSSSTVLSTFDTSSSKKKNLVNTKNNLLTTNKNPMNTSLTVSSLLMKKMKKIKVIIENEGKPDSIVLLEKIATSQASTKNNFGTTKNTSKKQLHHSVKQLSQNLIKQKNISKKMVGKMEKLQERLLHEKTSVEMKVNANTKKKRLELSKKQSGNNNVKFLQQKLEKLSFSKKSLKAKNKVESTNTKSVEERPRLKRRRDEGRWNREGRRRRGEGGRRRGEGERRRGEGERRRGKGRRRSNRDREVKVKPRKSLAENVASVAKTAIVAKTLTNILKPSRPRYSDRRRGPVIVRGPFRNPDVRRYPDNRSPYPQSGYTALDPEDAGGPSRKSKTHRHIVMSLLGAILCVVCIICIIKNQ